MRSDLLLRVAGLFDRALFVGDPGQLDPFSTVDTDRWAGLTWDPMQSAVAVLLRHNPDIPVHTLPVSWRLPASAAPVVAEAFYPFTGFRAAAAPGQRRLEFSTAPFGRNAFDQTLETAAASGWALYELPARHTLRTDTDAVTACAAVAARALQRGPVSLSLYPERAVVPVPVTATRIAVGTAHRDQAHAIRAILAANNLRGITVDTANRLQGREFDLVIVLHPLSGRRDATAFHLESGRLCVLTTRHRHACIVVARAGIPELLDAHPSTDPVHLNFPVKFPDGWEANQSLMAHLQHHKVRAP
jgi:AAA domain